MATKNPFGYTCLNRQMLERLMGEATPETALTPFMAEMLEGGLQGFGVPKEHDKRKSGAEVEQDFWVPPMLGNNVASHFEMMANEFLQEHKVLSRARKLLKADLQQEVPWELLQWAQPGWNRYEYTPASNFGDAHWTATLVDEPSESQLVLDFETFVKGSSFSMPIIGTATSDEAYYVWISPQLRSDGLNYCFALQGISQALQGLAKLYALAWVDCHPEFDGKTAPLPNIGRDKFVVNHNVAFDACRVAERYSFHNENKVYFFDTMAAHQVTRGLGSRQRWVANKKWSDGGKPKYYFHGTRKSLKACWEFHCTPDRGTGDKQWPESGDKKIRDIFVWAPTLKTIRKYWSKVMPYAMNDPIKTHEVFKEVWKVYRKHCPSLVTLASHLMLGASILPAEKDWPEWVKHCETVYKEKKAEMGQAFSDLAIEYHTAWQDGELDPATDDWLCMLNWKEVGLDADGKKVAFWYRDMAANGLTTKQSASHYLLKLLWNGQPLRKIAITPPEGGRKKQYGWCWRVAKFDEPMTLAEADAIGYDVRDDEGSIWKRVPHKEGDGRNVGALLGAEYLRYMDDLVLTCDGEATSDGKGKAHKVGLLTRVISYWQSARARISEQSYRTAINPLTGAKEYIIAPHVCPHNTVSYRTGENLWLTLAAHTAPKIGSEVKAKLRPPTGYAIVNFDFDSQELAILSAYSDKYAGASGSTAFSFSVLAGDKSQGTDMHTATARRVSEQVRDIAGEDICRDAAKQSIYAMCYGAYFKTVGRTIKFWHPRLPADVINKIAKPMLDSFKGARAKGEEYYQGGMASAAFNAMHDLLLQDEPATPVLFNKMPKAMWPAICGDMDAPEQLNWQVQSAGASMMQCAVVSSWWLAKKLDIKASLAITVHDELVYYCQKQYSELFAYCLQIAHAWGWCLLHYNLGIYDMPCIRAFASGISIDKVFRKYHKQDTATPTYPSTSPGKSVNMHDLLPQAEIAKQRWELLYA